MMKIKQKLKLSVKQKQLEFIIGSNEYRKALSELCVEINSGCKIANTEASVASIFENELHSFIKEIFGLKYNTEKEKSVNTERHVSKGRIDSKIGALVIEFKQQSSYNSINKKKKATNQIKNYLNGLYKDKETEYLGFVTDGVECQVIKMEKGKTIEGANECFKSKHLELLIKNIVFLDKVALTPENLVKDFCNSHTNNLSQQLTIELFKTLKSSATGRSQMLFKEWKELFRLAHDDKSKQKAIEERKKSLENIVRQKFNNNDDEYMSLYALQTTYAIIVKTIAYKVISKIRFSKSLIDFNVLANADLNSLQFTMNELEEGAIFRNLGIGNLLEGDFFTWYSSSEQWNNNVAEYISRIFKILTPYEDKALFDTVDIVNDLFKDLYMNIMPDKVRHSLGEFYTPAWLADNLIDNSLKKISTVEWKSLDPCSGSGTFLTVLIRKVLEENINKSKSEQLNSVLKRVKGIDLNPLAVLTARINYFINISPLIVEGDKFEIPVYLGDSSCVPSEILIDSVKCLEYKIQTMKGDIEIQLPKSIVNDPQLFSKTMTSIEGDIHCLDKKSINSKLINLIPKNEQKTQIINNIEKLSSQFIELEKNHWNGIWARIVTNFLTTANLGKFDIIVGNPPWIDWRNLPEGYRERIKSLCINRKLFSGDVVTGGINLNICALISNVCAQNWLGKNGVLAFLMPQSLIFQQSYEGFRNFELDNNQFLYLQEIFDWTSSGHPFNPVQHKFLSYFYSSKMIDYKNGVPAIHFIKTSRENLSKYKNTVEYYKVKHLFKEKRGIIGQVNKYNNIFSYADSIDELTSFKKISGKSKYVGRQGIEFYPQEVFLLKVDDTKPVKINEVFVRNFQNSSSRIKIPQQTTLLETKFLHPLIRGVDITRFHVKKSNFIVPFPYELKNKRSPLSIKELTKQSKFLAQYFIKLRSALESQSDHNSRIIGSKYNNEFYALARVGDYSFAKNYVVFRDNTKWVSAVVSEVDTLWGKKKRPQFQKHAFSISQDESGRCISLDEAHFLCAIFNSPITGKYILNSSDARTFKIRPLLNIPLFDKQILIHEELSRLSKLAHYNYDNKQIMNNIDIELDMLILKL